MKLVLAALLCLLAVAVAEGEFSFLASLGSSASCSSSELACGLKCCNLASHHCGADKTCQLNPISCPADGRHLYCPDVRRCVVIGGDDGEGRSNCGACGRTCGEDEVCTAGQAGWKCSPLGNIKTEQSLYEPSTAVHNEDGSVFVDADEIKVGPMGQGEERAFALPEHPAVSEVSVNEDEILEIESTICMTGLVAGDKFRVHAIPVKHAVKAAAINPSGTDITKEQNCVRITSSAPLRSVSLQRVGSPRRLMGRSAPTMKFQQTARAVRTAEYIRSEAALSAGSSEEDANIHGYSATPLVTIINFYFAGTLPSTICAA